jgi:protein involved in polysaccharide export with SLBB domain/beta-lactamase regulating signal transducer with metallopeptidase domain
MSDHFAGHVVWFWTTILLHFVWQGLLVASVVGLLLHAIPKTESPKRYWLLVVGLLCMIAMPVATGMLLETPADEHQVASPVEVGSTALASFPLSTPHAHAAPEALVASPRSSIEWLRSRLSDRAAVEASLRTAAFTIWLVMQVLLNGRLMMGGLLMWRIRYTATSVSESVQSVAIRLAARFGLRRVPRVFASTKIADAAAVGFFRGTVILPAAWLAQLSPEMIEAVLAHEFAHIRRHDVWINLVQRIVETVFFYHPAVWWLSGQMRIEREHCCDANAVEATGDSDTFAKTLELAARQRAGIEFGLVTSLGGRRMSLLNRVNRVLGQTRAEQNSIRWPLGLVALLVPVVLLIHAKQTTSVAADPQAQPVIAQEAGKPPVAYFPVGRTDPTTPEQPSPFEFQLQHSTGAYASFPTELTKVSLPNYIIEPPDVLLIEGIKLAPKGPQEIETQDVLQIVVLGTSPERPIASHYLVEANGKVSLGPGYGKVKLAGLTAQEAEKAIEKQLLRELDAVEVSVSVFQKSGQQHVSGEHLVGPDGTVNLGVYGQVYVAGKTVPQAREAVENRLSQFFEKPRVSLDVFVYNSKFYYVIVERPGKGDQVNRMPVSGTETVLDAIAQIGGLESASLRQIWISRPTEKGVGADQTLPVDFEAITRKGATETNYQLLPGDRLFISESMPESHKPSKIEDVVEKFNRLIASRQFDEAIRLAREASQTHPKHPVAQNMLMHADSLEENLAYRTQVNAESTANFIDELRQSKLKEVALQRALGKMIGVEFTDVPLETVIKSLAGRVGIDIVLDKEGLAAEGVTPEIPVTLELRQEISLRNALRLILDPYNLVTGVHAGVLRVTSVGMVDPVFVRTYSVRDLVGLPTRTPGKEEFSKLNYASLIGLITAVVAPDTWNEVGGPGAIRAFEANESLVISNSGNVHEQVQTLLQQLRTEAKLHGNRRPAEIER